MPDDLLSKPLYACTHCKTHTHSNNERREFVPLTTTTKFVLAGERRVQLVQTRSLLPFCNKALIKKFEN